MPALRIFPWSHQTLAHGLGCDQEGATDGHGIQRKALASDSPDLALAQTQCGPVSAPQWIGTRIDASLDHVPAQPCRIVPYPKPAGRPLWFDAGTLPVCSQLSTAGREQRPCTVSPYAHLDDGAAVP
jgi:hypothetical protein